jgi:hypothetical protein
MGGPFWRYVVSVRFMTVSTKGDNMSDEEFYKSVGGVLLPRGDKEVAWYFGWVPAQPDVDAYLRKRPLELFSDVGKHLASSGAGKTVLLYEAARNVWGRDLDPGPQLIGDCVSWGFSGCVDLVACIEVLAGEAEGFSWGLRTCTEALYALSRVEYGNLDGSSEDGSRGAWASAAVLQGGTLSRQRLGAYDPDRAKRWGASGLPDELEPEAREHLIRKSTLVRTFEEARDAIANGYSIAVCSSQGFKLVRDAEGFAAPSGTWYHCMKFIGSRDDHRPGLLCMNSWGSDRPLGPKGEHDIPDGSFWVDAEVCTHMF